jgi:hypothetical protein
VGTVTEGTVDAMTETEFVALHTPLPTEHSAGGPQKDKV